MTGAAPLAFPGSRALAGWWRQLAPLRPAGLWVAHLPLHRVEALARVRRPHRPDRFTLLVLEALALEPGATAAQLDGRLLLGRQVLGRVLRALEADGLARAGPGGRWTPTYLGHETRRLGEYARPCLERRTFWFLEPAGTRAAPRYLPVAAAVAPCPVAADWSFDPGLLPACVARPAAWKQGVGFPTDVDEVLTEASAAGEEAGPGAGPPAWQRVVVDRPECLTAAVVPTAGPGGDRLLGFAADTASWHLAAAPAFELGPGWAEVLPEAVADLPSETWREAWRAWCQATGLPAAEADACALRRQGPHLHVTPTPAVVQRLRAARGDALKGTAWLLAGAGRWRAAALLQLGTAGA